MLKTKINSVTLTGGATYDPVTDSTIPLFKSIQFENTTGADIKVKTSVTDNYVTYAAGEIFTLNSENPTESLSDAISVNGTGSLTIEITYYT